ncbi:DNA repair protein rad52 [Coccidioides immitis]|nr:DNA repair protein rad52 [Coccidioides immitis]
MNSATKATGHRPGDQHRSYPANVNAANPFEIPQQHKNEYTAQEIATLQSRLDKRLGPEYISSRAGPGGKRVHYLSADKCINLANEVFGFNGWSSAIQNIQIDFLDEHPNSSKVSLGLSVIVRVTLRNGTYHEDIGYGHIENCTGKAAAFEKAKKEGTTDALKRALRTFGNVLGNCIYDKDYLSKVTKVKAVPTKWDVDALHRHRDFAPLKKEPVIAPVAVRSEPHAEARNVSSRIPDIPTKLLDDPLSMDLENDFGSDAFDEADFGERHLSHPDEVILDDEPPPQIQNHRNNHPPAGPNVQRSTGNYAASNYMITPSKPPQSIVQSDTALPAPTDCITRQNVPQTNQYTTPKPQPPTRPQQPAHDSKFLVGKSTHSSRNLPPPLPCDQLKTKGETNIESKRNHSPLKPPSPFGSQIGQDSPSVEPGVWYSARAASVTEPGKPAPAFDPKFASPSIRKTLTIDHGKSAPVSRKTFQNVPPQLSSQTPHKAGMNIPPASQSSTPIPPRTIVDVTKRPGAGNFVSPARAPMTSSYRPPTRRSMTAAANNSSASNFPHGNSNQPLPTAQNLNGKRPLLSDITNRESISNDNETAKKPKANDNTTGSAAAENNQ